MRSLPSLWVIGIFLVLSGCGGSSSPSTIVIPPPTYAIGGTITGLAGTLVLQNNGGYNLPLSSNGSFTFSVTLQPNSSYDVTIAIQPANQVCSISNATGTASAAVTNIAIVCSLSSNATDVWTWMSGSEYLNAAGVYGTQGVASAGNTPGARRDAIAWTDVNGNFWLFAGSGAGSAGLLSDLWEYMPTGGEWVWQGGADTLGVAASYGSQGSPAGSNTPGAREGSAAWTGTGNLWLFGGDSVVGQNHEDFNDLWSYNPTSGMWTWFGGANTAGNAGLYGTLNVPGTSNLPPARTGATSWVDSAGTFWLFGGAQVDSSGGYAAVLNDIWSYNPASGAWTWVGGSSTPNAAGVYGTQGTAAVSNIPGARTGASVWLDASGNVWLFGGLGLGQNSTTQEYNDLWEYSPSSGAWTWVSGSNMPNAAGVYGTEGIAIAGNGPGARVSAVPWRDRSGNFWLFGGYGRDQSNGLGNLSDLWEYDLSAGVWIWVAGSASVDAPGNYGVQDTAAAGTTPGARDQAVGWLDSSGNFWTFGGYGVDASDVEGNLSDLWRFAQTP